MYNFNKKVAKLNCKSSYLFFLLKLKMEHKQAIYEQRLDESEVEINSLRCQLTELMAVYDDLQVDMHETHTINIKYSKKLIK